MKEKNKTKMKRENAAEKAYISHRKEMGELLQSYKFIRTFVLLVPREKMQPLAVVIVGKNFFLSFLVFGYNVLLSGDYKKMPVLIHFICFALFCNVVNIFFVFVFLKEKYKTETIATHTAFMNSIRIASYLIPISKKTRRKQTGNKYKIGNVPKRYIH